EILMDLLAVALLAAPLTTLAAAAMHTFGWTPAIVVREGQLRLEPAGILLGIVLTDVPMLLVVWGRVVRSRAATWASRGLRFGSWAQVRLGVVAGFGILVLMAIVGAILRGFGLVNQQMEQFAI